MSDTPNQFPTLPRSWQQVIASVLLAIVATLALTGRITWQKAEEIVGSGDPVTVKAPQPRKRIAWKLANEIVQQPADQPADAEAGDPAGITPDQILQIITLVEQVAPQVQKWLPTITPLIDQWLHPNQPPNNPPNNPPINNPPTNPPTATGLRIVFADATGKQLGAAQMQVAALVLQAGQTIDFTTSDAGPAITVRSGIAPIVSPVQPVTPTPVVTGAGDFANAIADQAQQATGQATLRTSAFVDSLLTLAVQNGTPKAVTDAIRAACPAIGVIPARDLTPAEIQAIRGVR